LVNTWGFGRAYIAESPGPGNIGPGEDAAGDCYESPANSKATHKKKKNQT